TTPKVPSISGRVVNGFGLMTLIFLDRRLRRLASVAPQGDGTIICGCSLWLLRSAQLEPDPSGTNFSATPFMQYRRRVGLGPPLKAGPRWPPQRRHDTAVRTMPKERSVVSSTALSSAAQKLGQPVPLSNFVFDE